MYVICEKNFKELTRYGAGVLVPDSAKQTCSCLVNILMQGPMEVDATAIPLCASNALNLFGSFTGSSWKIFNENRLIKYP